MNPIDNFVLVLSLRTHVPSDARILARRLTEMSDRVFTAMAETAVGIPDELAQEILVKLARFEIEAFERARRIPSASSPELAACDLARESAVQETLRRALWLRDREMAPAPLPHVAHLLGVELQGAPRTGSPWP